jgi:hypothetical protein
VALCAALSVGLALVSTPVTATAETLFGVESATFRWDSATGPVTGYRVYVSTNGRRSSVYATVSGTEVIAHAEYGQTISVSVAAVSGSSGTLVLGPRSDASDEVLFLQGSPPPLPPEPQPEPEPEPEPVPEPVVMGIPSDFDGDGRSDLLLQNKETGRLRMWSMEGTEIVEAEILGPGPSLPVIAIGDFNGDQTADILYFAEDSATLIFRITGSGTSSLPLDPDWYVASSGDYDGDGRTDLLVRNTDTTELAIWLLNGSQLIEVVSLFDFDEFVQSRTGDFDGDGTDDLIIRSSAGAVLMIRMRNGARAWITVLPETGLDWNIAAVGDLDADGRDDLVFRHTDGTVYVWLMDGSEVVSDGPLGSASPDWEIAGLLDLDGDGAADLVWRHVNGSIDAWLLDGLTILSQDEITKLGYRWTLVSAN